MLIFFFRKIYPPFHGGMGVYFQSNKGGIRKLIRDVGHKRKSISRLKHDLNVWVSNPF